MTYIQNPIGTANRRLDGPASSPQGGYDAKRVADPRCLGMEEVTRPAQEKTAMDGKPKLIVGGPDSPHPLHYICSHCSKPFYLPGNQPPKEAVAELLQNFGEHVKREHLSFLPDSNASSAEPDKQNNQ